MVEWNSHVATLCNGTIAASANEEILPTPSKARLHLLIHVHVSVRMFMWAVQSWYACGHIFFIILLMPNHWEVVCGMDGSKTHTHRNELPYLFIQAFLSITAIIRTNSFKFWENEGSIPSNFQFGSGNYGHDECLNSPSSSFHFS